MTTFRYRFDPLGATVDPNTEDFWRARIYDVATRDTLAEAVAISLGTWAAARPEDLEQGHRRHGWWATAFEAREIGSRIWKLLQTSLTPQILREAEGMARDALQWLIDDKIASSVDVVVTREGPTVLGWKVAVHRHGQSATQFAGLWGL